MIACFVSSTMVYVFDCLPKVNWASDSVMSVGFEGFEINLNRFLYDGRLRPDCYFNKIIFEYD